MSRLPFFFIITGIVSFVLFQIVTLRDLAAWIGDYPRGPEVWLRAHLLVLGWATMIAMGAVYQLINVVLQSNIYSEKLGYVHYGVFFVGMVGLLTGFNLADFRVIAVFASLAFGGFVLFGWNMAATLLRARQWNAITISAGLAVVYLLLTGLTGMLMGLNFHFGWWGDGHNRLFHAHMWLGAIGWFGLLIAGFSFKMLPMFYLAHQYPQRLQTVIVSLWNIAVIGGAVVYLSGGGYLWQWLALLVFVVAIACYVIHIRQIYRARHKADPGGGVSWTPVLAAALLAICVVALVATAIKPALFGDARAVAIAGWLYLWGFVAMTILAYMSKIVPFLWWTRKYGSLVGKQKIPTMAQMLNDRLAHYGLAAMAACLVAVVVGIGLSSSVIIAIGGSLLAICSLAYIALIAKVFTM